MEIPTIQPFLQYFGNVRDRTVRVARCIPADRLDAFGGKIRVDLGTSSRAKQCRVTASRPWMWSSWKGAGMQGLLGEEQPSDRVDPRPPD